jgi:hypothetical protein
MSGALITIVQCWYTQHTPFQLFPIICGVTLVCGKGTLTYLNTHSASGTRIFRTCIFNISYLLTKH